MFAQDAWTIGHGITINAGVRVDKEYLPASTSAGLTTNPINFSWGDKIAPRIGAAWDVFKDGRMKVFGSYGKFYDIMKLNVAISSFGGQFWNSCTYALDTSDLSVIKPALDSAGRYCIGAAGAEANWAGGSAPAGLTFIENINNRTFPTTCSTCSLTSTGVTPGLKPFSQHESTFGVDYQIKKNLALEVRWDRRRLDNAIKDSSLINAGNETFVIGNPGKGAERSFTSFYNFLYPGTPLDYGPLSASGGVTTPEHIFGAERSYDGLEFRLIRAPASVACDGFPPIPEPLPGQLHRPDQLRHFRRPSRRPQFTEQQPGFRRAVFLLQRVWRFLQRVAADGSSQYLQGLCLLRVG